MTRTVENEKEFLEDLLEEISKIEEPEIACRTLLERLEERYNQITNEEED